MTRTLLSAVTVLSLTLPSTASANDIVDFLRAIQGPAPRQLDRHDRLDRLDRHDRHDRLDRHDNHRVHRHLDHDPRGLGRREVIPTRVSRTQDLHRSGGRVPVQQLRRPVINQRPGVNFRISFGNRTPPQRTVVLPPSVLQIPPVPGSFGHLPHQIGEIVNCHVVLEPHVVIRDACDVAPHAVPVIVAVRDPHLSRFGSRGCVERLVYVEVLVPACPVQRVRVSPCQTKIRMDFGQYEVDITSRNGFVEIDYDD